MILEIIAKDLEDIRIINNSLADRIEFCASMDKDGLTPTIENIKKACAIASKDLMIMLRTNYESFELSNQDVNKLIEIINKTKDLNFKGYVFGAIKNDKVDIETLKKISTAIGNEKIITFHKAFDKLSNPVKEIKEFLKFSNVKNILTSGGPDNNPILRLENLKLFKENNINILVGGGVNMDNFKILKGEGFNDFHFGKAVRETNSYESPLSITKINYIKNFV